MSLEKEATRWLFLKAEIDAIKQEFDEQTMVLMRMMDDEGASVVIAPNALGVVTEIQKKYRGSYDATEASKVYDVLPEHQVDAGRSLINTETKVVTKVDAVRAKQLEKLGGTVAEIIQRARAIGQTPYITSKEA